MKYQVKDFKIKKALYFLKLEVIMAKKYDSTNLVKIYIENDFAHEF